MEQDDDELEVEIFDMAATRPELMWGIPYSMAGTLLFSVVLFLGYFQLPSFVNTIIADVFVVVAACMFWGAAKEMLRIDYHGWGNFVAWCKLDARLLDTHEAHGAALSALPISSMYRCEWSSHAG